VNEKRKTLFLLPERKANMAITYKLSCALRFFFQRISAGGKSSFYSQIMTKLPLRQFSSLVAVLETPSQAATFVIGM